VETFDVVAKFLIGAAGVALSATVAWATAEHNRELAARQARAAEQQVRQQSESLLAQRRIAAAQMLAAQAPALARADPHGRAFTLALLQLIDPELTGQVGDVLLAGAPDAAASSEAKRLIASSAQAARDAGFARHLDDARKFREFGLEAAAAREYLRAYETLPDIRKRPLSERIALARNSYDRGDYSTAATTLERALGAVPSR
jgi:hypothetical protein